MKVFIGSFLILSFTSAHACLNQAQSIFEARMQERRHSNIAVYPEGIYLKSGDELNLYGTVFKYNEDVLIYEGSSEFMSGFGVEAIVMNPQICGFVEMLQVYAE